MNFAQRLDHEVIGVLAGMTRNGEPDLLPTIVSMFLESTPSILATLKHGAASGDVRSLQRTGHDLKSSSASLGAGLLSSRCAELEALARSGTSLGMSELVREIEAEFEAVKPELEALLTSRPQTEGLEFRTFPHH